MHSWKLCTVVNHHKLSSNKRQTLALLQELVAGLIPLTFLPTSRYIGFMVFHSETVTTWPAESASAGCSWVSNGKWPEDLIHLDLPCDNIRHRLLNFRKWSISWRSLVFSFGFLTQRACNFHAGFQDTPLHSEGSPCGLGLLRCLPSD